MNSLYHKIAVASICTALSFTLGANQEAKAATFTLTATGFTVTYVPGYTTDEPGYTEIYSGQPFISEAGYSDLVARAFYEFNIGNFSLAPNTVIKSAFFNVLVTDIRPSKYFHIDIVGYVGNGIPELSDFEAGERLSFGDLEPYAYFPSHLRSVDVTQFVKERVSNGDAFAGFGVRPSTMTDYNGSATLANIAELTIETEPVPEPTTIFGSAIALGVGGWLKRKKSSQQNKTTSLH